MGRQNKLINMNADVLLLMAMKQNFIPVTDDCELIIGIVTCHNML